MEFIKKWWLRIIILEISLKSLFNVSIKPKRIYIIRKGNLLIVNLGVDNEQKILYHKLQAFKDKDKVK